MRRLLAVVMVFGVAASARAAPLFPLPLSSNDIIGARTLAMAAVRGAPSGNDGIFLNAATLAAQKRYAVDGQYLISRAGQRSDAHWATASVVDSQTSALSAGLAYTRILSSGKFHGNHFALALAGSPAKKFYLGATGKLLQLDGGKKIRAATADASAFFQATSALTLGASGYNLIPIGTVEHVSRAVGVGVAYGTDATYRLAFDWRADFERRGRMTNAFAVGGEYLLAEMLPIRAGFLRDETLGGRWWSVGIGVVTPDGFALDVGYRQAVGIPGARAFAAALKVFLFQ